METGGGGVPDQHSIAPPTPRVCPFQVHVGMGLPTYEQQQHAQQS